MRLHANAALSVRQRRRMVLLVVEQDWSIRLAADRRLAADLRLVADPHWLADRPPPLLPYR